MVNTFDELMESLETEIKEANNFMANYKWEGDDHSLYHNKLGTYKSLLKFKKILLEILRSKDYQERQFQHVSSACVSQQQLHSLINRGEVITISKLFNIIVAGLEVEIDHTIDVSLE